MFTARDLHLPPQIQQEIEKWAGRQGVSTEEFILLAIAEKIDTLSHCVTGDNTQQSLEAFNAKSPEPSKIYRKEGILVVKTELPENFDITTFIDKLRGHWIVRG
jgi:hypothetical protein